MKVRIKKHATYLGVYLYKGVKFLGIEGAWFSNFMVFIEPVLVKIHDWNHKRAYKVRIDPHDLWDFDNTLAHIIHPALVMIKDQKHGIFWTHDADMPEELKHIRSSDENMGPQVDGTFDESRCNWVMNEMIFAFGEIINGSKNEPDTVTFRDDAYTAYHARISNGLLLFGKYYLSMWT